MDRALDDRFALPADLSVVSHACLHHSGFHSRRHA
jgi:hypothetical protein